MTKNNKDKPDFDAYLENIQEKTRQDHKWITIAASLLGSAFILECLKPYGSIEQPIINKPHVIKDIPEEMFKNILKMDIFLEKYHYIYSKKELDTFKQLGEELKHHGCFMDSRTIENTALEWVGQKNRTLSKFGELEAYKNGTLDIYSAVEERGFKILIPWSATGDNPCDLCLAWDGELFEVDEFPSPPHYACQCNQPMADPILIK